MGFEILHAELHRCDGQHRDEHVTRLALAETGLFDLQWREYLDSPQGRFAVFYAARNRL